MSKKFFIPVKKHFEWFMRKTEAKKHKRIITITENNFYQFYFNKKEKCLYVKKTHFTGEMTENQYREQIITWLKINIKYRPRKILVDNSAFDFIIIPELQKWVSDTLLKPSQTLGVRKIAFVSSPNIFTNVSIRQAMEEENLSIEFKFFPDIEQAREWLNSTEE